ncbi:dTDP-4-dehydrorhamnose reductase [Alphaproteobacteria bacterium]|nr:dTDP-4-dehydrorhamnose reductase [Alphaproteobacteria bacterium]
MILVFGQTGQVAKELQSIAVVKALGRKDSDLADPQACVRSIRHHKPKCVINAAAYTSVDKAEEEETLATIINGDAPTAMARVCAELGIPFVHISTDYVFPGTGKMPWCPNDQTKPQNVYGRSKLAAEVGIQASGATYAILRTSWVISAHGANFVKTMLSLSQKKDELNIVSDQIGGPTPAQDIAVACLQIAEQLIQEPSKAGIYHFSGLPNISWASFAIEIFEKAQKSVNITPILTTNYPTPAARPLNSRMDCSTTQKTFGIKRPYWRKGLGKILKDLGII